jgi:hypothetical protein
LISFGTVMSEIGVAALDLYDVSRRANLLHSHLTRPETFNFSD